MLMRENRYDERMIPSSRCTVCCACVASAVAAGWYDSWSGSVSCRARYGLWIRGLVNSRLDAVISK